MLDRRQLAKTLAGSAVMMGGGTITNGFAQKSGEAAAPSQVMAAAVENGKTRYPFFTMDVHVHFGSDGPGRSQMTRPWLQQIEDMYGPWNEVYDAEGELVHRPEDDFDTIGDVDRLVEFLDEKGVDVAVIFPFSPNRVAKTREEVRGDGTNEATAQAIQKYPDRLIGLCGHDPFVSLWGGVEELRKRVAEDGFKGMKVYPPYHHIDPTDRDLDLLYKMASDLGAVITFHTGWTPLERAPYKYGDPLLIDEVALRFPDLKINLAHTGGVSLWEEAVLIAARHKNLSLDVSSWCGYPPNHLVKMLDLARRLVGLDRVLYGSEHTLCAPTELIGLLLNINDYVDHFGIQKFSENDIKNIMGANAAKRYGIKPTKRT